ncbi:MAG: hypothetical protein FVQ80_02165 [Planctomycetes bacterium]|nr:hypothetical protein [Planctomycetota bacterium]
MQLTVVMKFRIAAALAAGIVVIGFGAWPLVASHEPMVTVFIDIITPMTAIILVALAVFVGFIGYFLAWPYGKEIAGLAVPAGLAVWAIRSANMTKLMLANQTIQQRQQIFATFTWEPIFWLIVVFAGFGGVKIAQKISPQKELDEDFETKSGTNLKKYINSAIAVVGSVLIGQILIGILAQDFRLPDTVLGSVVAQPATAQIVFAVLLAFGVAAFLVKLLLNAAYIWPIVAAAITTALVSFACKRQDLLQRLMDRHPLVFFSDVIAAILPIQMIAFAAMGAIAGYWLAIRYQYWRIHGI